jgi:hypothetical protein
MEGAQVMEEGTLHFARALAANHTLRALRFGKHALRDAGAETLVAYGLVTNTTLTSLDLRCNSLSEVAGSSLARLLLENGSLTCEHPPTCAPPSRFSTQQGCRYLCTREWIYLRHLSCIRPCAATAVSCVRHSLHCACLQQACLSRLDAGLLSQRWCYPATGCETTERRRWRRRCRTTVR